MPSEVVEPGSRSVVQSIDLSRCKRRVLRQTQVGAGALKIRGDGERAANDGASSKEGRAVRKTNARLEVPSAIEAVVERPAGAILVGKFDRAGRHVVVGLLIVGFNPWSKSLVTQTEIQGKVLVNLPGIGNE